MCVFLCLSLITNPLSSVTFTSCGHLRQHGKPTSGYTAEEKWFSMPWQPLAVITYLARLTSFGFGKTVSLWGHGCPIISSVSCVVFSQGSAIFCLQMLGLKVDNCSLLGVVLRTKHFLPRILTVIIKWKCQNLQIQLKTIIVSNTPSITKWCVTFGHKHNYHCS